MMLLSVFKEFLFIESSDNLHLHSNLSMVNVQMHVLIILASHLDWNLCPFYFSILCIGSEGIFFIGNTYI